MEPVNCIYALDGRNRVHIFRGTGAWRRDGGPYSRIPAKQAALLLREEFGERLPGHLRSHPNEYVWLMRNTAPLRVHDLEPLRRYLVRREGNNWEREVWTRWTPLQTSRDYDLAMRLASLWREADGYGSWTVRWEPGSSVERRCEHSRCGYMAFRGLEPMTPRLRANLLKLIDMCEHPLSDSAEQARRLTDATYKMHVFDEEI